jgi:predicted MFS family arabinose efflux permease
LNDFLSQERNFSVPDATFLVFLFGLGCAVGGVLGGYLGQKAQAINRSYLPLFMSATTLLGILPFLGLLNSNFSSARGPRAVFFSISGGIIASLPAVNVRPVLINVNPPETRGASLTAANLLINLGRGFGPSCITLMGTIWHVDRKFAFNVTVRYSDSMISMYCRHRTASQRLTLPV